MLQKRKDFRISSILTKFSFVITIFLSYKFSFHIYLKNPHNLQITNILFRYFMLHIFQVCILKQENFKTWIYPTNSEKNVRL